MAFKRIKNLTTNAPHNLESRNVFSKFLPFTEEKIMSYLTSIWCFFRLHVVERQRHIYETPCIISSILLPIIPEFLMGGSRMVQVPSANEYINKNRLIVSSGWTVSNIISYLRYLLAFKICRTVSFLGGLGRNVRVFCKESSREPKPSWGGIFFSGGDFFFSSMSIVGFCSMHNTFLK